MSKGGRYLNKNKKVKKSRKGRKVLWIVLAVLLALILALLIGGIVIYDKFIGNINVVEVETQDYTMSDELLAMMGTEPPTEVTLPTETTVPVETEPVYTNEDIVNILVVGQSYREGETSRLADTMILVTLNPENKTVTLTSFMRDTYVDLPDYMGKKCGWNRINTNYALGYVWGGTGGAMEMTNLCLKNNFGIDVDFNVEVGFEAFQKIIDILGGVRIELTQAEANYLNDHAEDWWSQTEFEEGETRLFGEEALAYARMRKAEGDSDSDIKRTARQRNLIIQLVKKLANKMINNGPETIQKLADEIMPMITTNTTPDVITDVLLKAIPMLPQLKLEQGTCPVEGTYWSELKETPDGPAHVLVFASEQQKKLMRVITEGAPAETTPAKTTP